MCVCVGSELTNCYQHANLKTMQNIYIYEIINFLHVSHTFFLVFVSTTHFAFASLPYCVVYMYVFFSRLPLLLRFKSYQQQQRREHTQTHIHVLRRIMCVCEAKLLRESLSCFFLTLNNFELPFALAHLYPTPPLAYIHHLQLAYTPFVTCLIMHFNAQSMTERGCCCLKRS